MSLDYPQLGGVVVPNDGLCHLKDQEYTASTSMVSLKKIHDSSFKTSDPMFDDRWLNCRAGWKKD